MSCAIDACTNTPRTVRLKHKEKRIYFHRFPTSKEICKLWIEKIGRRINPKFARVCSEHFSDEDYQRDLKNELLELPIQKRLKPTAVPHLKLSDPQTRIEFVDVDKKGHKEPVPDEATEEVQIVKVEQNYEELLNKYETVTKENQEIKMELDECKTKLAKLENDLVKIGSQFMLEKERRLQMENALKYLCNVSEIKLLIVE